MADNKSKDLRNTSKIKGKTFFEEVKNMPKKQQKKFAEEMFSIVHGIADKTENQTI